MKKIWLLFILILICTSGNHLFSREKYNFNSGWKVYVGDVKGAESASFDDSSWKQVTLPYAWNEDSAFRVSIEKLPTGIAWYRKAFKLPASSAGKKVFLEFEGIRQAGEFYLNGKLIGIHENGVMAFGFDVTDFLTSGVNEIAVRIDNSWDYREKATDSKFQWSDRNFYANYGGINKNVWLHVTDKIYQTLPLYSNLKTTGVYIYAKNINVSTKTATVTAESEIRNEYPDAKKFQYEVEVKDMDGKTIKTFNGENITLAPGETKIVSAASSLDHLNFWSWGYGYLYTVSTRIKMDNKLVDEVNTKTGFRKTEFRNGTVFLNDRAIMVKGYAQRTTNEWPALGNSVPAWLSDFSNSLMVESNGNLVRWMHVTPWKQDIESCDRVGLMEAMPAGDSEKDVDGIRWKQRTEVMRDAIIYNRNNPSIIFYECGNKGISEEHMKEMKAIRDQYDPNGGRAIGAREMLNSKIAEYGGEMLYTNKSAKIPFWAMEYSRDEGMRKYWDEFTPPYHKDGDGPMHNGQDAAVYNRNQDSHAIEDVIRWNEFWIERPGTGDRVNAGGVNIIFSESNTHHRGAENYRHSGEVDAMRIPKDGFFAHKVMWDGWVDVEKNSTHIIGHWNYAPGVKKNIYVVSTGEKTEIFINGQSKGFGERSNNFLFTFKNIEWQPGVIKAVSYDFNNKKLSEDEIKTAGEPAAVKLTVKTSPMGLKADGADVALVDVEVVDAQGNRCPTALNMIHFLLDGNAEWRGGIAQGPDNYILSKELPVECGINRVIIRSTPNAGNIRLTATSEGLKTAVLEIKSVPVKVEDGLSTQMPSDGLTSNLKRGPTPAGPSFNVSRISLKIAEATAGANTEKAGASYDDDETTAWANDGNVSTAWIKYTLAKESTINEVHLKLNNFRTRRYNLKVMVDDKVVFEGQTRNSLGYCDVSFKETKGKTVSIALSNTNSSQAKDTLGEEVSGKNLGDGVSTNSSNSKGTLGIIEAEIFQRLNK